MIFNKLIPELCVSNIDESKKFYIKILGFNINYEREEDKFVFIEYEGNQIMLEQSSDNWNTGILEYPYGRGINISMEVKDVDLIYKNLKDNNYPIFKQMMINEYRKDNEILKNKEFLILDPDGYLLRFNQDLKDNINI